MKRGKSGKRKRASHVANSKSRLRYGKGVSFRTFKHRAQTGK